MMDYKQMTSDMKAFLKRDCDNVNCHVHRHNRKALQNNSNELMPSTRAADPSSSNLPQPGGSDNAQTAPRSLAERKVEIKREDINVQIPSSCALQGPNIVTYITTNNNHIGEELYSRTMASNKNKEEFELKKMERANAMLKSAQEGAHLQLIEKKEEAVVLKRTIGTINMKNERRKRKACENAIILDKYKGKVRETEEALRTLEWKLSGAEKWTTYYRKLAQERLREVCRLKRQLGLDVEEDHDDDDASSGTLETLNTTFLELDLTTGSPKLAQE